MMSLTMKSVVGVIMGGVVGAIVGAGVLAAIVAADANAPHSTTMLYAPAAVRPIVAGMQTTVPTNTRTVYSSLDSDANGALQVTYEGGPSYQGAPNTMYSEKVADRKHLPWAFAAFFAAMGIINMVFLSFSQPKDVAMAAICSKRDEEMGLSRRQALLGASAVCGSLATASPAFALFGFGGDQNKVYEDDTLGLVEQIKEVLVLDRDDPTKPDRVTKLRRDMNAWVAKYRRNPKFGGRSSYGQLYSVINAVAGHYTNFGAKTPIPKKRAATIVKEISMVETLVPKGR